MSVKAKLKIILKANDTIVAESANPQLWQNVLVAINSTDSNATDLVDQGALTQEQAEKGSLIGGAKDTVTLFAKELDVSKDDLKGACGPTTEAPFIHLDEHYWEALKKQTPERGPKAIAPLALSATLLALWKKKAGLDAPTTKEAIAALATIQITSKNSARAIRNCEWLQMRGENIVLNPAQISKAIKIARAYCLKQNPHS